MANPLYARLQATADKMVRKFGQSGTVKRETPPDAVEGGDPVITSHAVKLVPTTYDRQYIDGQNIVSSDRQIYISAVGLAIVPSVGDIVTAGGVDYRIVATDQNNFDGATNVVFICQGRIDA